MPAERHAGPGDAALPIGQVPSPAALAAFADGARRDGRALVVGALITDDEDRIYVQRRSPGRALFPGCWDFVGGHAELGESVEQALACEVREETGWRLLALGAVVERLDWEAAGQARREVDLLVRVDGDLAHPRLETDKHDLGRWLRSEDVDLLLERRDPDDVWVHRVASRAFALLSRPA